MLCCCSEDHSLDAEEVTVQATQALNSIENWSLRNRRLREEFERKRRDLVMRKATVEQERREHEALKGRLETVGVGSTRQQDLIRIQQHLEGINESLDKLGSQQRQIDLLMLELAQRETGSRAQAEKIRDHLASIAHVTTTGDSPRRLKTKSSATLVSTESLEA